MKQKSILGKKQTLLPRSSRSDIRRQELVLAAYHLIAAKGFEGLRVRDVAADAGVNIATLHYYFNSKEDLIRGVVEYMVHLFLTSKAPLPVEDNETAAQKLRRIFLDLQYQLQQAPQMFAVFTELHLRSQRDPLVRAILRNLNEDWQAHVEAICQEGVRQGTFRPDINVQRAASEVIALIKGISLQAASQLDTFNFERLAADVEQWFTYPGVKTFVPAKGRKGT
ncbi:MAG: TetR/AcrR family transcriptional regulator [Anaerolineales bacterium]|nr:TetR/AcrR family transcriptional regulator [Anaerolineales bacterium]